MDALYIKTWNDCLPRLLPWKPQTFEMSTPMDIPVVALERGFTHKILCPIKSQSSIDSGTNCKQKWPTKVQNILIAAIISILSSVKNIFSLIFHLK